MDELFKITNCYQDTNYYYFFRALNKRDMAGIRDKSTLDEAGHISKIVTDSTFYNHKDRYNEFSELTLEEMVNHVKTHYDKDTNCISLSSDANVCLTYGRNDYEDKYVIIKVPKAELGHTTFNAGKYIYEEILKRVNTYLEEHQNTLTDIQKYYIESLKNISTKEQLESLKKTLPEEYVDKTNDEFQNGLEFIKSKPYEGYSDTENLAKDKLVMLLDVLDFEVIKGKTNRFVIQTMGSAFSSRELEYYKEVPKEKIVEMPTSLVEIMALIQQVPETAEIKEIKSYLITHLEEVRQSTKEVDYSHFNPEELDLSLDNLYDLTAGKISYKEAKELYLNSMYLVKAKLRSFYSVNLLNQILGNNPKYHNALQSLLDNSLGIEPTIMARSGNHVLKVSDTVALYLPKNYQSLYDYVNNLQIQDMYDLFTNPTNVFNTLFTKYISDKELKPQNKEEWYVNGLIDAIDLESLNLKTNFNEMQRRKIVNALVSHNFMDYYEKVKALSDDGSIATSMFASLIANRKEFTNDSDIILDQLKDYIGYNNLKEYNLPLRKLQRIAYGKTEEGFAKKNFATAVMPTGSGKSFLALSEMLDRKSQKMLYIAPNDIILNQIEDYIYEFFGYTDYHTLFPNLTLTTYQDLKDKKTNNLKDKYNDIYAFIILDELHRSGAPEWSKFVNELMASQDQENIKVLGLTATPERDRDDKDMAVYWARYFGYSDEEIELNKHLAINETLESAIKAGLLPNPKFINCLYSYKSDGTLDEMYEQINMLDDGEKKAKAFSKYEQLCRSVEQSQGIEKILGDNLSKDGKYVVFLPVGRKENGDFETEDGTKINRIQAVKVVEDYTILIRQYLYSNEYMKVHGDKLLSIYNKIIEKQELSSDDKDFLNKEQDNIMLLDMVKIKHKPAALNTFNSTMVSVIARHQDWEKLDKKTLKIRIEVKTSDMVDTNSLLSYYSNSKNKAELAEFNKETNGKPKLLFVMDKLNEGAHLKGVKGIVWLRPLSVDSRILFYQQLGRCIHSYPDGHIFTEEERPIIMDLVNNINTVNLKRNQSPINDLEDLKIIMAWITANGDKLPDKNSSILEEKNYALKLNVILYRHIKYFNNQEELNNVKYKRVIEEILRLGSLIDLWNIKIDEPTRQRKVKELERDEEKFLQGFLQVESSVRDFVDSKEKIDELASHESTFDKIFNYLSILKNQSLDINNINPDDKLKVIKNGNNCILQIIKKKTKQENGKKVITNEEEYKELGLIWIGYYVYVFRHGKAYRDSKSPDLEADQISRLKNLNFIFDWEVDPILNPRSFDDYVLLLKEMQKAKYKIGRDINSIKSEEVVRITKINADYEFEYFANREEAKNKYGENVEVIGIGLVIYWFKRGKKNGSYQDLTAEQIKGLRNIVLNVVPENERDPIMAPKSFEDYALLLKEIQKSQDKTSRDINSIKSEEVVRITKINADYEFEYFANREEAKSKYGENVEVIGIGVIINYFKRGKSSSGEKDLTAEQIKGLRNIGLNVVPENERDPIMAPKSFEDYALLLKEIQKSQDKTSRDINSIKSEEVVRITKINADYEFEYFANREEAKSKYGENVEVIGIGVIINCFKRGKSSSGEKDLTAEQIKRLRDTGLMVVPENERDPIMAPKSFEDYVLLLKEMRKSKDKTGHDINSIKSLEVVRITKINADYEFEYFANKEEAKNKYGENVEVIGIGLVIYRFKRGKKTIKKDLTVEQIKKLRDTGLMVVPEKERDPIMMPKSFEDYVLLLKEMQKTKDKTNRDINDIKQTEAVRITKINAEYEFEYFVNREAAKVKYGEDVETIGIGPVIYCFKRGKLSNSGKDLTAEQIKWLRDIGLTVVPENERDPIMAPKNFEDYVLLFKEMSKNKIDINVIKADNKMRIMKNDNGYDFQIVHKSEIKVNGKRTIANALEYNQDDLMAIGTKIYYLRKGKYSASTYLTIDQKQTLLNIGFKFSKGIEDKIYKQEICMQHNIDLKINDEIIERISKIELISKINYLEASNLELVDSTGKLIDIFSMSSIDIQDNYGISLETIINTYGKGKTKK